MAYRAQCAASATSSPFARRGSPPTSAHVDTPGARAAAQCEGVMYGLGPCRMEVTHCRNGPSVSVNGSGRSRPGRCVLQQFETSSPRMFFCRGSEPSLGTSGKAYKSRYTSTKCCVLFQHCSNGVWDSQVSAACNEPTEFCDAGAFICLRIASRRWRASSILCRRWYPCSRPTSTSPARMSDFSRSTVPKKRENRPASSSNGASLDPLKIVISIDF